MNSFIIVALFACLAAANAGVLAPAAHILQGPSSRTTVVGPDGSAISSVSPGGAVISSVAPGVAAYSAPVVAPAVAAYAAPHHVVAYAAPHVTAYAAPHVAAYAAPTFARSAVVPGGVISTTRGVVAPGYVAPVFAGHGVVF